MCVTLLLCSGCARWGFVPAGAVDGAAADHPGADATADGAALDSIHIDGGSEDQRTVDDVSTDTSALDADAPADAPLADAALPDSASSADTTVADALPLTDTAIPDTETPADAPAADMASPDTGPADLSPPDAALPDTALTPDLPWPADTITQDLPPPPTGVLAATAIGSTGTDEGMAVAVDPNGNIYLAGSFFGTVDFGDGPRTSVGYEDIFLVSYTASGSFRWVVTPGGNNHDYVQAVAVDPSGAPAITGSFLSSSIDFGSGPLANASPGSNDIFMAGFAPDGACRWARAVGNLGYDQGRGVAADAAGNLYFTGSFAGKVDFGGGNVTSSGQSADIFVVSYSSSGAFRWLKTPGANTPEFGTGIAIDGASNLYLVGRFWGPFDFGGGPLPYSGDADMFVASLTSTGSYRWAIGVGGTGEETPQSVAVDPGGNLAVTGYYQGSASFGGGSPTLPSAGAWDVFVASYTANNGSFRWAKGFGGTGYELGEAVALDSAGNSYVTGSFQGTADFGGTPLSSAGGSDIFICSTTSTGAMRWVKQLGGLGSDVGNGVAVAGTGIYATGSFEGTVDFGAAVLSSAGSSDVFLLRLQP